MSLTPLPTPPTRADAANFSTRADAFMLALPTFVTEVNNLEAAVDADASLASSSAQVAASAANAAVWVSGTSYVIGDCRYSPTTRYIYRRITNGAGTTDPSADATNWALATTNQLAVNTVSGTSVALTNNMHALLTNAAVTTATLPAGPAVGDTCAVTALNGRVDNVIARNGQLIMGLSEDMTMDVPNRTAYLRFCGASYGWRLL